MQLEEFYVCWHGAMWRPDEITALPPIADPDPTLPVCKVCLVPKQPSEFRADRTTCKSCEGKYLKQWRRQQHEQGMELLDLIHDQEGIL